MERKAKTPLKVKPAQWGAGIAILGVCAALLVATKTGGREEEPLLVQRTLLLAVIQGDTKAIGQALHDGADPNAPLPHKNNGFLVRLKQRGQMVVSPAQSERLQRNLAYTPDSALTLAARSCNPDATRLLLKAGANPNIRRGYGETALITLAFAAGQTARVDACTETARALLQHKANPNAIDEDGHTPLGAAVLSNAPPQFVRVLLKAGADPQPVRAYLWDGANEEVQALLKR